MKALSVSFGHAFNRHRPLSSCLQITEDDMDRNRLALSREFVSQRDVKTRWHISTGPGRHLPFAGRAHF
jgi:hypothetical protein